ncbi:MAG: cytochrome c5 family protein [Halieaceae bacterium]|nr:cytochrome c5 family protein [Halieaceae bacterium]
MRGGFAKNDWQAFFLAITLASCSGGDDSVSPAVVKAASGGTPPPQYAASCGACHAVGVAGAPKTGDSEAWVARLNARGMDGLIASVRNGVNAMPPGGLCNSCSDEEHAELINYMAAAN